jgi:hypothetical protein
LADLGMLVGAVVVAHDVQLAARVGGGDLLDEAQELLVAMPREAGFNDLAGGPVERNFADPAVSRHDAGLAGSSPWWRAP